MRIPIIFVKSKSVEFDFPQLRFNSFKFNTNMRMNGRITRYQITFPFPCFKHSLE